jgi:hypothetical protein
MNPLSANPVTVLQDARATRSRTTYRGHRDRAVRAARAARQALERVEH